MARVQQDEDRVSLIQARDEYIRSLAHVTLEELAKKYKVSLSRLQKASSEDGWKEKRQEYQSQIQVRTNERSLEKDVDIITEIRKKSVDVYHKLLNSINDGLDSGSLQPSSLKEATEALEKLAKLVPFNPIAQGPGTVGVSVETPTQSVMQRLNKLGVQSKDQYVGGVIEEVEDADHSIDEPAL